MSDINTPPKQAVVLLSGGMDSAVVLALAQAAGYHCTALSFDYGQRHRAELAAAARVCAVAGVTHRVMHLDLRAFGGSALTDDAIAVPTANTAALRSPNASAIPVTYVPARNTMFLSCALALAEVLGAHDIFIGVNAVDYSGYPDCRPQYIAAFEVLANLATKRGVEGETLTIHAPIIQLSKADIAREGQRLGVDFASTVSCYQATSEGLACGQCDACTLRAKGFRDAGYSDPTRYAQPPLLPLTLNA